MGRPTRILGAAGGFLAALVIAGSAVGADHPVTVANFSFTPAALTIDVGDSVTWSVASGTHTITADNPGAFPDHPAPLSAGGSFSATFTTAGTYAYHCSFHAVMHGQITVVPAATPTPAPTAAPTGTPSPATPVPTVRPTTPPTDAGDVPSDRSLPLLPIVLLGSLTAAAAFYVIRRRRV